MTTVCICGGGNIGHVTAALLAARQSEYRVHLLTNNPQRWSETVYATLPDGSSVGGKIHKISNNPSEVITDADIVLLCLPGYAIRNTLYAVSTHLKKAAAVGSVVASTGFFFEAFNISALANNALFALQRVPFIARTITYGSQAALLGFKQSLNASIEQCQEKELLRMQLQQIFNTPVHLLANYYEASLTNSNPLLHPARLFSLWKDYQEGVIYSRIPYFYEEWSDEASSLYINMDAEFQQLLTHLPITEGSIPTVLDYYESYDVASLTAKLRSIKAFKGISSPMVKKGDGYIPDFNSRYFTEDFPYGLAIIHRLAQEKNLNTPYINNVYHWGEEMMSTYK